MFKFLKKSFIFLGSCLLLAYFSHSKSYSAETESPKSEFIAPIMGAPPAIDGKFTESEWADALSFDGMMSAKTGKIEERSARSYIGATEDAFYFAIISELPKEGSILSKVDQENAKLIYDDACEIYVDPNPGSDAGVRYQVIFNSVSKKCYIAEVRGSSVKPESWDGKAEIANSIAEGKWICEVKLPVSSVAEHRKTSSGTWGISICRDWKNPWVFSSAPSSIFNGSDVRIRFEDGAPAIQFAFTEDPASLKIKGDLSMKNTAEKPISLSCLINTDLDIMPSVRREDSVTVKPGETARITYDASASAANCGRFDFSILVNSGGKTLYSRKLAWNQKSMRKSRWDTVAEKPLPFDFDFAYYPYSNKLRVRNLFQNYKGKLPNDAVYSVTEKDTKKEIKVFSIPAGKNEIAETMLPSLEGKYAITLTLNGEKLSKDFERKHYGWEGNHLGLSRKVYPPFTPMEVKEGETPVLCTVLRDHRIEPSCLPEQICANGKDLLAAPIELKSNGKALDIKSFKFTEKSEDAVAMTSELDGGTFKAKASARMEYDGALKYELTLLQGKIENLSLEFPLKDSESKMFHAMGDGLRNTIYDYLPSGEGEIWNASKVSCSDLPEKFCSYIFIGTPMRGLSFFADNDKGWSWDRKTPNLTLRRQGGTLLLKVNLVNKPIEIGESRKIVFGIQAAPVKPRLADWRTRWHNGRYSLLGTDINWLCGPGVCANVYPPDRDMYFWQMIAKGNVEKVTAAEIEECRKRGYKQFEPFKDYDQTKKDWDSAVKYNIGGGRLGHSMVFYYNRAVYNALDEYGTFMSEWTLPDFEARNFIPSRGEIKIVPSKSYDDFATYWYAESFKYGRNQGVYWDNWFFCPSYNTEMTDAYYNEDGSITPACGIWQMRELVKRTFQMMNEKGMTPITWAHMTSTSVLPLLSFATAQLDWEWKYSEGDVQNRFTRPYCQLVSNGELAGVIPVMLSDHGKQTSDEWIQRTFAGVCFVHELQIMNIEMQYAWKTIYIPMVGKYAGQPNLKAFRYWDEDSPIRASDKDYAWILYSLPGEKSLLIVCGYKDADGIAVFDIDLKALGLDAKSSCKNFETGESIRLSDGKIRIQLKKHEVLALEVSK